MSKTLNDEYINKFGKPLPHFYFIKFLNTKSNKKFIEDAINSNKPLTKMQMLEYMEFKMWDFNEIKVDLKMTSVNGEPTDILDETAVQEMLFLATHDHLTVSALIEEYVNAFKKHPQIGYGFEPNSAIEVEFLLESLFENHPLRKWQIKKIESIQSEQCDICHMLHIIY